MQRNKLIIEVFTNKHFSKASRITFDIFKFSYHGNKTNAFIILDHFNEILLKHGKQ